MGHFEGCFFIPELPEGTDLREGRILLHCCCAPCSTAILEWMVEEGLRPGIFFSNSNIVPFDEYTLRREELVRYALSYGLEVVDDDYDHEAWLDFVMERTSGHPEGPERGPRCLACFEFRLRRAALHAAANGYGILTTTLASSRWKDISQVNEAGLRAIAFAKDYFPGKNCKLTWWGQNWRKGGLQERRNSLIKSCALYNQNRCGCEFA